MPVVVRCPYCDRERWLLIHEKCKCGSSFVTIHIEGEVGDRTFYCNFSLPGQDIKSAIAKEGSGMEGPVRDILYGNASLKLKEGKNRIYDDTVTPNRHKPNTPPPQTPSANQQVAANQSMQFPVGIMLSIKSEGETARGKFVEVAKIYDKEWMVLDTGADSVYAKVGSKVLEVVKVYIPINKISTIGILKADYLAYGPGKEYTTPEDYAKYIKSMV